MDNGMSTHLSDIAEIPMQRFGRVHKGARDAETLHSRDYLAPYKPTFADAAYYELASCLAVPCNDFNRLKQTIAGYWVGLV